MNVRPLIADMTARLLSSHTLGLIEYSDELVKGVLGQMDKADALGVSLVYKPVVVFRIRRENRKEGPNHTDELRSE